MTIAGILIAFGAGIFGAAIGGLAAFELVGLLVIAGATIGLVLPDAFSTYIGLPFGSFGPHAGGFASGVAAAAFAAKQGKLSTGKDIVSGLAGLASPATLFIGGIFGCVGYVCVYLLSMCPNFSATLAWTDTVALTVLISGIATRLLFGKTGVFGKVPEGQSRWCPPKEARWVPYQSDHLELLVIGLGAGLFAGYLGVTFGGYGALLAFGIAAFSLIFLQTGFKIPITHHIMLPAAIAATLSGSVIVAGVFGIICAFVGEFMARLFYVYGDTHIDPPAATIAPMTTLIHLLGAIGFFSAISLP